MDAQIWITGRAGSEVEYKKVREGLTFASFRLGCTPRLRKADGWQDAHTVWISVNCSGNLAEGVRGSISKGDPLIVVGKLRTDRWEQSDGTTKEVLRIQASAVGHDLSFGNTAFTKTARSSIAAEVAEEEQSEESDAVADEVSEPPF